MLPEGEDGWDEEEERTQREDDGKGERDFRKGLKLLQKNVKNSCVVLIYFDLCSRLSQLLIFFIIVFYNPFQEH